MKKSTRLFFTLAFLLFFYCLIFETNLFFDKFEKEKWIRPPGPIPMNCVRDDMVHDIMNNVIHQGMKKSSVLEKLGPPDADEGNILSYHLGNCDLIDVEVFSIYFDSEYGVFEMKVKQH